jgi:hypothetical protein
LANGWLARNTDRRVDALMLFILRHGGENAVGVC